MSEINSTVAAFVETFNRFKVENLGLLADLETAIDDHLDEVDEVLDDHAADLKTSLGENAAAAAGESEEAREEATAIAEDWVTDNVSNGTLTDRIAVVLWLKGCEAGEAEIRKHLPTSETVTVRLTLDVTYALNGEAASDMVHRLQLMCERAIGDGMLTGDTAAEVDEYSMEVAIQPNPLSDAGQ